MTPSPQHLKEAREILSRHIFGNKSMEKSLVMQISQALSLSESRGVKKGMMEAAEKIADCKKWPAIPTDEMIDWLEGVAKQALEQFGGWR